MRHTLPRPPVGTRRRTPVVASTLAGALLCLTLGAPPPAGAATHAAPAVGDVYSIVRWTVEDGLPQNTVSDIAQSPDGYLWLTTNGGLVRFDGLRFRHFHHADHPGLPSGRMTYVHIDGGGVLWVGTHGDDLARYTDGAFVRAGRGMGLPGGAVDWLAEDLHGSLYAAPANPAGGAALYRWEGNRFHPVKPVAPPPGTGPRVLLNPLGAPYVPGGAGYAAALPAGSTLDLAGLAGYTEAGETADGRAYDGGVLIATAGQVVHYGADGRTVETWSYPETLPPPRNVDQDAEGSIWAITEEGLYRLSNGPHPLLALPDDEEVGRFERVYCDREGNIWVGTFLSGLLRLKPKVFQVFDRTDGLPNHTVRTVCEGPDGSVWTAQVGDPGFARLPPGGKGFETFPGAPGRSGVLTALVDRSGGLWLGTYGDGVLHYDYRGGRFVPDDPSPAPPPAAPDYVFTLFQRRDGSVWAGGPGGLLRLAPGKPRLFTTADGLLRDDVRAFAEDAGGRFYIGTEDGVNVYSDGRFQGAYTRADGLSYGEVWALHAGPRGAVWIGTGGGGLHRLKDGRITAFTGGASAPDRSIAAVIDDGHGRLWMTSKRGVFWAPLSELDAYADGAADEVYYRHYGTSDGLPSLESVGALGPTSLRARDGRLWFATYKGLAVVDPAQLIENTVAPAVHIERAEVDGETVWEAGGGAGSFTVPPGPHHVRFDFAGISLADPRRVRFRYRLTGLHADWIQAERGAGSVSFDNLAPGRYRFEVSAINRDGVEATAPAALALALRPHPWERADFRVAAALLTLAAVALAVRYFATRKLRLRLVEAEYQQALVEERGRIARDMHDDLGANLTRIAILSEVLKRDGLDPEGVARQLDRISGTARDLVDGIGELVWAVNPQNDSLEDFVAYLRAYAHRFADDTGLDCRVDLPTETRPAAAPAAAPNAAAVTLTTETRRNLFLVAKEALNNVAKHAGATTVTLSLRRHRDGLRLAVEDDGHGFDTSGDARFHNGLRNMRKRVADLGGEVVVESRPGAGTRVEAAVDIAP